MRLIFSSEYERTRKKGPIPESAKGPLDRTKDRTVYCIGILLPYTTFRDQLDNKVPTTEIQAHGMDGAMLPISNPKAGKCIFLYCFPLCYLYDSFFFFFFFFFFVCMSVRVCACVCMCMCLRACVFLFNRRNRGRGRQGVQI
eukprot:Rmarinus@m.19770